MENYQLDIDYLLDGKNLSRRIPVDLDAYRQVRDSTQNDTEYGEIVGTLDSESTSN